MANVKTNNRLLFSLKIHLCNASIPTPRETTQRNEHGGPSSPSFFPFLSYHLPRLLLPTSSFSLPHFLFCFSPISFISTCRLTLHTVQLHVHVWTRPPPRNLLLTEFVATGVLVGGFIRCSRWKRSNEFIVLVILPSYVHHWPRSKDRHSGCCDQQIIEKQYLRICLRKINRSWWVLLTFIRVIWIMSQFYNFLSFFFFFIKIGEFIE